MDLGFLNTQKRRTTLKNNFLNNFTVLKKIVILFFILNSIQLFSLNIKKEYSEKYMIELHSWLPDTFEELKSVNENELYQLAKEKYHYHNDKTNLYTKTELSQIEEFIDEITLNQYFVNILNAERQKRGLSSNIKISPSLIKAAKIRSKELAQQSKISHKRTNGKEFWTVFDEVDSKYSNSSSFENALGSSVASEAQMLSEKYMAEHFFELWKESEGHWKAMINPEIKEIGLNCAFGFSKNKNFLSHINYAILLGVK